MLDGNPCRRAARKQKELEIDLVSRMKRVVESGLALLAKIKEKSKRKRPGRPTERAP
jgi:ABC-type transporter Mla MlaB component